MHRRRSKRERPEGFLDRPNREVVRSRSTTPDPSRPGPSDAQTSLASPANIAKDPPVTDQNQRADNPNSGTLVPTFLVTPVASGSGHDSPATNPIISPANHPSRAESHPQSHPSLNPPSNFPASTPPQEPTVSSSTNVKANRPATLLTHGLRRLGRVASMLPPLNVAVDLLADGVEIMSTVDKGHQEFELLAAGIAAKVEILEAHLKQPNATEITGSALGVLSELQAEAEKIGARQARMRTGKYARAEQDIEYIAACYRRIDGLFQQLMSDVMLSTARIAHETRDTASKNLSRTNEVLGAASKTFDETHQHVLNNYLDRMQPVKEARYDSGSAEVRRNGCTSNTRTLVLKGLADWANNANSAKIYWMDGMAGTGKTTISYSFCQMLKGLNRLGASFFCSRQLPGCRDTGRIVPTIAYQIARHSSVFQRELCHVLSADPDISSTSIASQFENLLRRPLQAAGSAIGTMLLVVVIDALDECSDRTGKHDILDALFQFAAGLPVAFFVTCRPEQGLIHKARSSGQDIRWIFYLHNIEESLVQADIETYLRSEFASVPLADHQIDQLVERSGKLFIYAATVVRFLDLKHTPIMSQQRLAIILGISPSSTSTVYQPLDDLYTVILSAALENPAMQPWEVENIRLVLYTVLCAKEPMSVEALAHLLEKSVDDVLLATGPLRSLLHESESESLVSTLHASFPDYMYDPGRSKQFYYDEAAHHGTLTRRCFDLIQMALKFNICGLESSFVFDKDVPDLSTSISRVIPPHLSYACKYWSEHLADSKPDEEHLILVGRFLRYEALFWIEAMNLKKCMVRAVAMLYAAYNIMTARGASEDALKICQDIIRFATVIATSPVSKSTPHIYTSLLTLWNRDSSLWKHYGPHVNNCAVTEVSAIKDREPTQVGEWTTGTRITAATISRDGQRIVSSGFDHSLLVWDTYTGARLAGPFIGHHAWISSVSLSLDGTRLASGSDDGTIRVWNIDTNQAVGSPFKEHQMRFQSVEFSPNACHLAFTSSQAYTIRIWCPQTGQLVVNPLLGHTNVVHSLAYSPDGNRLVSGSDDHTLRIWSSHDGRLITSPLEGHTDPVSAVAFSADGRCIVSGSVDCTVRMWDAQTGHIIKVIAEHGRSVTSVAFSPDMRHIVSGGRDGTIRICDLETGQSAGKPYTKHRDEIEFVGYSSDGHHIISGSVNGTVRIWGAQLGHAQLNGPVRHAISPISSVCFSSDSKRIAGGYGDGNIRVWDACTGDTVLIAPFKPYVSAFWVRFDSVSSVAFAPDGSKIAFSSNCQPVSIWDLNTGDILVGRIGFEGNHGCHYSVAFSPDGRHVVSGSLCTIRIWDVETGDTVGCSFEGHTGIVYSVVYSPDGHHLASGSQDSTIRVWDVRTGQTVVGPLLGHTECVRSVLFSPEGRRIISGSWDTTIRVWDAETGRQVGEPFRGHTAKVHSAICSPDGTIIVSGSDDHTVWIWEAETGRAVAGPLQAHTGQVRSLAYSPDGSCFASGSEDGSIRVWPSPVHDAGQIDPLDSWTMDDDGWIITPDSRLLFWVPQDLRTGLNRPQNAVVLRPGGWLGLDFKGAAIGQKWTECFEHQYVSKTNIRE
ncbi:hypothetical protein FRC12_002455 [Ceratobasidium sp. 428]|nr:hypothetical protein FRC12_002455 [Ceratobasidium sp. 428]